MIDLAWEISLSSYQNGTGEGVEVRKKLFVDKTICTGCRYCEAVCSLVHSQDHQVQPGQARIMVHRDLLNSIFTPVVCRHCGKPPCAEACHFGAILIDPQLGIHTIDAQKCTGCLACLEACPFGAMSFDNRQDVAMMCDLCQGDPKCVKFCRALPQVGRSALAYMTVREWLKKKAELASAKSGETDRV